jgi:hypothetical protein
MTHDLLGNTIAALQGMVERVEVVDLVDNTYFARVYVKLRDERFAVDSRPSDAIALALRAPSPIFVANHVLEQSKIEPTPELEEARAEGDAQEEEDEWTRILKNFNPSGREKIN